MTEGRHTGVADLTTPVCRSKMEPVVDIGLTWENALNEHAKLESESLWNRVQARLEEVPQLAHEIGCEVLLYSDIGGFNWALNAVKRGERRPTLSQKKRRRLHRYFDVHDTMLGVEPAPIVRAGKFEMVVTSDRNEALSEWMTCAGMLIDQFNEYAKATPRSLWSETFVRIEKDLGQVLSGITGGV